MTTISVIEVPEEEKEDPPPKAKRVPFGFSRALKNEEDEGNKDELTDQTRDDEEWVARVERANLAYLDRIAQRERLEDAVARGDVPLC
jgi:hypothetical protein